MDESGDTATKDVNEQTTGRKRQLEQVTGDTCELTHSDVSSSSTIRDVVNMESSSFTFQGPSSLCGLKLEAIFHPKFENETRNNQDVRVQMKELVAAQKGTLEVSLKHSGSLLLWSGGQRFYSKNATDNQFTHVGEITLRQHFYRAWHDGKKNSSPNDVEKIYHECGDYIQKHRLTLAFELVTSVLGHHGDIPNRDFLILTAVADRRAERFYSTSELVCLAHLFRLPHNDSWVFGTPASVEKLFYLYDTTRETGLAHDTVHALTASADSHVCSMYPHEAFQGNILEGIVIRYVSYGGTGTPQEQLEHMKQLALASQDILSKIPPEMPPCFDLAKKAPGKLPRILTTNVRDIFQHCLASKPMHWDFDREAFEREVWNVLVDSDGMDQRRTVQRWGAGKNASRGHLPTMIKEMLQESSVELDEESRRIAAMILSLHNLKGRADYKVLRESEPGGKVRWLCIVHVHLDSVFQKFHKHAKKGDMFLFRGCCIELVTDERNNKDLEIMDSYSESAIAQQVMAQNNGDESLMLKMKFLPYMVRTFGCRNGLGVLKTGGPEAFDEYTMNLMTKWGMSQKAKETWQPFFHAWGIYAHARLSGQEDEQARNTESELLLPLNSTFYLDHLESFSNQYYGGKLKQEPLNEKKSTFRGLVVVVSLDIGAAKTFSGYLAAELDGLRQCVNVSSIKEKDVIMSTLPLGGGVVYSASVNDGLSGLRKFFKTFVDSIFVVLVDCDKESIRDLEETGKDCSALKGKTESWRNNKCQTFEISRVLPDIENQQDFSTNSKVQELVKQLWTKSRALAKPDTRPGLLLYFPVVPGSGKSTLCDSQSTKEIERIVKDLAAVDNEPARKVVVLEGDRVKKKYWQKVKQDRDRNPSSIFIADKNAPPASWTSIGNAFSRGVAVPVLPDDASLQTTTIEGARFKDGSFNANYVHYYPFSLHYLAVCMARVLKRPAGSHDGKLDRSTTSACMVVAMFVGLYRNTTAEQFQDVLDIMVSEKTGATASMPPIRVPFFAQQTLPPLPSDLEDALKKSLQLQVGWDKSKKDATDSEIIDMDTTLRRLLKTHDGMLRKLTADEEVSRKSFLAQAESRIRALQALSSVSAQAIEPTESSFTKLVSVDVNVADVHDLLISCSKTHAPLSSFLAMASEGEADEAPSKGSLPGNNFVKNTHVTLAYHTETAQHVMKNLYEPVKGRSLDVQINGFMWSDNVAALSATLSSVTNDEHKLEIPVSSNPFTHITVWYREGASAVLANQLPKMVKDGKAEFLELENPRTLIGVVSFWADDKSSK